MFYWIYEIPNEWLALLIAGAFVLFYWIGVIVIRPILRLFIRPGAGTNDVVGYILSCFCVFYGLLLGLLAVAAYQNYSQVESNVSREATALAVLYEDVGAYPEPQRQNLRWLLRDYCRYVIKYAWPAQQHGIIAEGGQPRLQAFQERMLEFEPQSPGQQVAHAEALRQFNVLLEQRRLRLNSVTTGIPAIMWYVVLIGSIVALAMAWMFETKFLTQLLLGGLLAFFVGTMIFLIAAMDNPFRGDFSVSAEPFERLFQNMMED